MLLRPAGGQGALRLAQVGCTCPVCVHSEPAGGQGTLRLGAAEACGAPFECSSGLQATRSGLLGSARNFACLSWERVWAAGEGRWSSWGAADPGVPTVTTRHTLQPWRSCRASPLMQKGVSTSTGLHLHTQKTLSSTDKAAASSCYSLAWKGPSASSTCVPPSCGRAGSGQHGCSRDLRVPVSLHGGSERVAWVWSDALCTRTLRRGMDCFGL